MVRRKKETTKLPVSIVKKRTYKKKKKSSSEIENPLTSTAVGAEKKARRIISSESSILSYSQGVTVQEKAYQEKRMIMWSGVTFFMVLVLVFWVYNIRQVIHETEVAQTKNQDIFGEIAGLKEEISDQIKDAKDDIANFREEVKFLQTSTSTDQIVSTSTASFEENVTLPMENEASLNSGALNASSSEKSFN